MLAVYFKHNKSAYAIHVFQKEQPHNYTRKIISKRFIMWMVHYTDDYYMYV